MNKVNNILIEPYSEDAESAVIACILIDKEAVDIVTAILSPDDFYFKQNQYIYQAVQSLVIANKPVDLVSVSEELKRMKKYKEVGGGYLSQVADRPVSSGNVEYYAKVVLEKSTLRHLIKNVQKIERTAREQSKNAEEIVDEAENLILEVRNIKIKEEVVPIKPVLDKVMSDIELRGETHSPVIGVPTGYKRLDDLTLGFSPSNFVVLAGRPSMGKTALALNIAVYITKKENIPVLFFSLEMSKEELVSRLLVSETKIDSNRIRRGYLNEEEWMRLNEVSGKFANLPFYIDTTPNISILDLRAKARRMKREKDIGIIIVDYIQLVQGPTTENRQQEVAAISRMLKALARELDVPVVGLSQLSRKPEDRRGNQDPKLSDLRESGSLEQDADIVIFIKRPKALGENASEDNAEILVAKNRNGPMGKLTLKFLRSSMRFVETAPEVETI